MNDRSISTLLGLQRSIVGMLCMVLLVGLGERMADRFLPVYLLALGGGAISIGLLNGSQNLLGAIYSLVGGLCSDRFGARKSLLLFNALAMSGYFIVILAPRWEVVIGGAILFMSWSAISLPAMMSLIAKALPNNKRTMGVSVHSLLRRVPMALGPVIGGLFIDHWGVQSGVRWAFSLALGLAIIAAIVQQILMKDDTASSELVPPVVKNPARMFALMHPHLKRLLVSDILVRFCEQIPLAFVVVWCLKTIASPVTGFQFGILCAVEMTVAALVYIPVAYFADQREKKPFVVITFLFFSLFPLVLLFCHSFWPLVFAFAVRGLKEFGEPTRKALILDLCPEQARAGMFGLYYLIRDVVVSVAAFGGAFLWMISPATNFIAAFSFGIAGMIWFWARVPSRAPQS